jgi:hypothetical protein
MKANSLILLTILFLGLSFSSIAGDFQSMFAKEGSYASIILSLSDNIKNKLDAQKDSIRTELDFNEDSNNREYNMSLKKKLASFSSASLCDDSDANGTLNDLYDTLKYKLRDINDEDPLRGMRPFGSNPTLGYKEVSGSDKYWKKIESFYSDKFCEIVSKRECISGKEKFPVFQYRQQLENLFSKENSDLDDDKEARIKVCQIVVKEYINIGLHYNLEFK